MASPFLLFFLFSGSPTFLLGTRPFLRNLLHFQTIGTLEHSDNVRTAFLISVVGIILWWWQYSRKVAVLNDEGHGEGGETANEEINPLSLSNSHYLMPQGPSKVGIDTLKQLLEGLPHAAMLMDADCRIILANPQSINVLRLTTTQLQGQESFSHNVQWI